MAEGVDKDFKKKTPMHKIEKPPFYAAWATPILHDALAGLRTNGRCEVLDVRGQVIPGVGHWLMEEAPKTVIPAITNVR